MFTKMVVVLVVAGLVFGGAAATASAAQGSLPMDALYPIKTLSESVELGLTSGTQAKLEKALEHVQRRVEEMAALGEMGEEVPQHLAAGYTEQVEYTLRLASRLSAAELAQVLAKIQISLQEQMVVVEQLQAAQPEDTQLAAVAERLRRYLGLVSLGLNDPQMFGERLAGLLQAGEGSSSTAEPGFTESPSVTETPAPGGDNSNTANANSNGDDSNANSDANANSNGDDSNTNGDDANSNGDDSNTNSDDDANSNGDGSNTNSDDNGNDDDDNGNDDDDNGNDDDGNENDDDDNGNDGDGNGNEDSASVTSQSAGTSSLLSGLYAFIAWIGEAVFSA